MKTDVVKPQEIFYNPTRLLVPLFQRPYVWTREMQWEPLWQDIVRLTDVLSKHDQNATHFLGAIVVQRNDPCCTYRVVRGAPSLSSIPS